MQEMLRVELKHMKEIGIRSILAPHLYELMPECEEKRRRLPSIEVDIVGKYTVTFHFVKRCFGLRRVSNRNSLWDHSKLESMIH